MPQHQLIGIAIFVLGLVDTAVGHLLIAPRVSDAQKRTVLRVAFTMSGLGIAAVGFAVYGGMITL